MSAHHRRSKTGVSASLSYPWHILQGTILLLLLLCAFFLRVYLLGKQSIWFDEAITLNLATSSFSEIIANRAANIHPPLYFFLMRLWVLFSGLDPFAVRYASVLASFLQVPAVFLAGRIWLGRGTAWIAALLIALSPLSIIYAQEVRVYAILPLFYLALLTVGYTLSNRQHADRRSWLLLALVEVIALHLHYISIFAVTYVAVWLFWRLWRQRRRLALRRWFLAQLSVALATLPWAVLVLAHWRESIPGRAPTEPVPLIYLVRQLWTFHLTGLAGVVERSPVPLLTGAVALLLLLLLLWRLIQPPLRNGLLLSSAHWLLPLLAALSLWSIRSYSHPRYVIIFSGAFFLWLAYLLSSVGGGRPALPLRLPLFGLLLTLSMLSLQWYYFHPQIGKKDDTRGVAHYLETEARPNDLILMPYLDRSLLFEYQGQTPVRMAELGNREQMWSELQAWTSPTDTVYLVTPEKGSLDWQNVLPFALEAAGSMVARREFDGLLLRTYRLEEAVVRPLPSPVAVDVTGLALADAWVEPAVVAGTAVPVALAWQPAAEGGSPEQPYGISLTLRDVDGWSLVRRDQLLVDASGRSATLWAEDRTVTYHLLPLPTGTPPLTYTVHVSVYALGDEGPESVMAGEQSMLLGTTRLVPAAGTEDGYRDANPVQTLPQPQRFPEGLALVGASVDRETVTPGQTLFVRLRWEVTDSSLPEVRPRLALVQDGRALTSTATAPVLERYPTERWQQGEVVTEHRRLEVPAAASGTATVLLSLGEVEVALARVEISSVAHQFEPPPVTRPVAVEFGEFARLVGYDLPQTVISSGEPVELTLYWESLATGAERTYTVFTHLLAEDGHLIGQHDGLPAQGQRPLTSWVEGEFIDDRHTLAFSEPEYTGPARIGVGLYHPDSGIRLPTATGEDVFYLPEVLEITPRE